MRKQELNDIPPVILTVGLALSLATAVEAQTDSLNSYHKALALVERSLDAHGGLAMIESAGGFELCLDGTFDLTTRLQGRSPFRSEPTAINECIAYDAKGKRVSYDINWFNYHASNQDLREVHDNHGRVLFVDKLNRNGGWLPVGIVADHRERFTRVLPNMLLAEALQRRGSLRFSGHDRIDGRRVNTVSYTTIAGDTLSLFIDSKTQLLSSASALLEMPLLGDSGLQWQWSDYSASDEGFVTPHRFVARLAGKVMKDVTVTTSLGVNAGVFGPPDGIDISGPPESAAALSDFVPYGQRPPQVETLAPRVHMVTDLRPGFGLLFVEFNDYILAVDAPSGWYEMNQIPPMNWSYGDSIAALGKKYLRAIKQTVPDKPVRYVVLTHHHSDHIGGLRAFVAEGTTVLAGEGAAHMAKGAVDARASLSSDEWHDEGGVALEIEVISGERVIADESMEVQLIELPAGNPKADNYLMVYLPKQKLLYTTAFIYPIPKSVFPPRESVALSSYFVEWLDSSGLEVETIYNVHGMRRVEEWQLGAIRSLGTVRQGSH